MVKSSINGFDFTADSSISGASQTDGASALRLANGGRMLTVDEGVVEWSSKMIYRVMALNSQKRVYIL